MQNPLQAVQGVASEAASFANSMAISAQPSQENAEPFGDLLADSVNQINTLELQARNAVDGLMTGSGVDVHQAIIATQKVEMAFELALAVRNKAVQAYQQVMSMQF